MAEKKVPVESGLDKQVDDPSYLEMIRTVIKRVMDENKITPENVSGEADISSPSNLKKIFRSKRFFRTKAFAQFEPHSRRKPPHSDCKRNWKSAHSWSLLDLREQTLCHHYCQYCKKCGAKVRPLYDESSVERMAQWACKTYLICMRLKEPDQCSVNDGDDKEDNSKGPHDQQRCGMCRLMRRACWKKGK